jgi:hypothetical protein
VTLVDTKDTLDLTVSQPTKTLRRVSYEGELYLNLADIVYLCEASQERHLVHGHPVQAEVMENLASTFSILLLLTV